MSWEPVRLRMHRPRSQNVSLRWPVNAVKGNNRLSLAEMQELLEQLLTLDNPYHCPHGRPTMIVMTKQELERKFKRIV